ncbi:hypothetical protein CHUAL_007508 [Chamberlinius hualienensis]
MKKPSFFVVFLTKGNRAKDMSYEQKKVQCGGENIILFSSLSVIELLYTGYISNLNELLLAIVALVASGRRGKSKVRNEGIRKVLIPFPFIRLDAKPMRYHSTAPFYQRANVFVNRFPGGVNYNHKLNGHGSDISVSFQSYPSSKLVYKKNNYKAQ